MRALRNVCKGLFAVAVLTWLGLPAAVVLGLPLWSAPAVGVVVLHLLN